MNCALATDIRVAYEGHDREALERALAQVQDLAAIAAMTRPCHMDPVSLGRRRAEVQTELNRIDAEIERRADAARRQQQAAHDEWLRQNPEPSRQSLAPGA